LRSVTIPYKPRPQFTPFHKRAHRWAVLVAHRRAGKTVACVNDLIRRAVTEGKPDGRYAYIAPFYAQAKQTAWDYLKHYAAPLVKSPDDIRESELSVRLVTGATIRLYGADNPNALRGIYLDGVVMDEVADMRPSLWIEVIRPALSDRAGWAVFIGTPKGKNAFWKLYDDATRDDEWFTLVLRASETGILASAELDSARRAMTGDKYDQEYECSFEAAITGAVYGKWLREATDAGRVGVVPLSPNVPVNTAWDLGYDDATAIWFWQLLRGEIRVIDYYEASGEDIGHYIDVLKAKPYSYGKHYVPHDAANELLAAGGRSIVQQAMERGVPMHIVPATSQQNGIEAARLTIERCWFDSDKCRTGVEALRQYQFEFNEETKTFRSRPKHDWTSHGADAFEIIGQVWREVRNANDATKSTPKFLHEMTANDVFWPKTKHAERRTRI
jgi:phage terminase large subunit